MDMDKDGLLNYNEFQNYVQSREQTMEKELGSKFINKTEEQSKKVYKFLCDIGQSYRGPSINAL